MDTEVERVLDREPATAALARQVYEAVLAVLPTGVVTTDGERVGFGTSAGYQGLLFVVSAHRAHVTLGIANGVGLPDPAGLMEGTGKVHRHVKIRDAADVARPELTALLHAAVARTVTE